MAARGPLTGSATRLRATSLLLLLVLAGGIARAQTAGDFDGDGFSNAADDCPYVFDPEQQDSSLPADGIGDACTCGDTDDDGRVTLADAAVLRRAIAGLDPGVADLPKCSVVGGSRDCDDADAARLRQVLADPTDALDPVCLAFVGASDLPQRMSVAGDSITRGFAASCECNVGLTCLLECAFGGTEQPEFSWFSGDDSDVFSLRDRYQHFDPTIGALDNAAESGARMRGGSDSFEIQAGRISGQEDSQLIVVLLGGNDICSRECVSGCSSPLFSDTEWRDALRLGLDILVANVPENAVIYLGSVPRVQELRAVGLEKQDGESDIDCELVWDAFDICRIATDEGTLNGETLAVRLAAIEERQRRYNEILVEEAAAYSANDAGQNPRGVAVVAEYAGEQSPSVGTFSWGPEHINGADCFHPSLLGQNEIAELLWQSSPRR